MRIFRSTPFVSVLGGIHLFLPNISIGTWHRTYHQLCVDSRSRSSRSAPPATACTYNAYLSLFIVYISFCWCNKFPLNRHKCKASVRKMLRLFSVFRANGFVCIVRYRLSADSVQCSVCRMYSDIHLNVRFEIEWYVCCSTIISTNTNTTVLDQSQEHTILHFNAITNFHLANTSKHIACTLPCRILTLQCHNQINIRIVD